VVGGRIRRDLDGRSLKWALLEALDVQEVPAPPDDAPQALPARDKSPSR
jgi:hypothetical protein